MTAQKRRPRLLERRPAETASGLTGVGALTLLIEQAATGHVPAVGIVGSAAGFIAAAVTFLVDHGGIVGMLRLLVHGRTSG